jgi:hypothetical protein
LKSNGSVHHWRVALTSILAITGKRSSRVGQSLLLRHRSAARDSSGRTISVDRPRLRTLLCEESWLRLSLWRCGRVSTDLYRYEALPRPCITPFYYISDLPNLANARDQHTLTALHYAVWIRADHFFTLSIKIAKQFSEATETAEC